MGLLAQATDGKVELLVRLLVPLPMTRNPNRFSPV